MLNAKEIQVKQQSINPSTNQNIFVFLYKGLWGICFIYAIIFLLKFLWKKFYFYNEREVTKMTSFINSSSKLFFNLNLRYFSTLQISVTYFYLCQLITFDCLCRGNRHMVQGFRDPFSYLFKNQGNSSINRPEKLCS